MDNYELLISRRSIREFTTEIPSHETLIKCIRAAMYAPSARNQQPWQFMIIDDRNVMDKLSEVSENLRLIKILPVIIGVFADSTFDKTPNYWVQDCAAATQNILLAAHALEIGSVWMGVYPREDRYIPVKQVLNLPENITPFSFVGIGYPIEKPILPERFHPERIKYNEWENNL